MVYTIKRLAEVHEGINCTFFVTLEHRQKISRDRACSVLETDLKPNSDDESILL